MKMKIAACLVLPVFLLVFSACSQFDLGPLETYLEPPAETLAAKGGQFAGTQSASLLQTAQAGIATQSDNLGEIAKAQAATYAASLIDTAQANLVTQSASQATLAPTQAAGLKLTADAFVSTQIAGNLPLAKTQAAMLIQGTPEFILGTALSGSQAGDDPLVIALEQTIQAAVLQSTPAPPSGQQPGQPQQPTNQPVPFVAQPAATAVPPPAAGQALTGGTIVTFTVPEGLYISQAARLLGVALERIVILNPTRQTWPPTPGAVIIVSRQPEDLPVLGRQAPWSDTPGCDVSRVYWLEPPITCSPVQLDVVDGFTNSIGCITPANPFGRARHHTVYLGWNLQGSGGVNSYGWFIDRGKSAVVVGPALVYATAQSVECGANR